METPMDAARSFTFEDRSALELARNGVLIHLSTAHILTVVNVGVVISVYGRYDFVGEAIESVLKQSLRPREVVVVADDPDRVPFRDLVYVVEARDRKYGMAIMKGVDATTSDIIALLEDDDRFHPDKLRIVSRILEKHPEIITIHNLQKYIDVNGSEVSYDDPRAQVHEVHQPNFTLLLDKRNALMWYRKYTSLHHNVSSLTLRRGIFERHRALIKDLELALDFAFFVLSINDGYYLHIPERLTFYRIGSGATTEDFRGDSAKVSRRLCVLIRWGYDKYILYNYVRNSMLKNVIESSGFTYHLILYWRFKPFIGCDVEIPLTKVDMLRHALRGLGSVHDTLSLRIAVLEILTTLLGLSKWGRGWLADLSLRMHYGIDLASITNSRPAESLSS